MTPTTTKHGAVSDPLASSPELKHQTQHDATATDLDRKFRLLDLPVELQRLVIYHALNGPYDITLTYERISMLRSTFKVLGIPPTTLPLLLTSHHISDLTSKWHVSLFTGRLVLNSVFILVPLRRQSRFEYLRTHTRILHFSDSSVHPERWGRYFDSFGALRQIEIEFPMVKKLDVELPLDDVLGGREDQRLIGCLDRFMVSLLGGSGLKFLITARFALKEGFGDWSGVVVSGLLSVTLLE